MTVQDAIGRNTLMGHSDSKLKIPVYEIFGSTQIRILAQNLFYSGHGLFSVWIFFRRDGANHGLCGDKEAS